MKFEARDWFKHMNFGYVFLFGIMRWKRESISVLVLV